MKGVTHFGAIVIRTLLLSGAALDRYRGTSYEKLGTIWEGLASANQESRVVIFDAPSVLIRQVEKECDYSFIKT